MPSRRPTPTETEIKLRVADVAGPVRELRRLGARCLGRVLEGNTVFDTPDSYFHRHGRLLRVRLEIPRPSQLAPGGRRRAWITSKSPAPAARRRYKENLEREVEVPNIRVLAASLRRLGFRPAFRYEKFRTTFRLPGLHLDLDETPVGVFLEIEGQPSAIDRAARALGFLRGDYIRGTYWDLFVLECHERGRIPRNMLFSS